MEGIKPPEPLLDPKHWNKWKIAFDFYLKATEKMSKPVKIALLINCLGERWIDVYNTLNVNAEEDKMKDVISKFDNVKTNQFDQYITELKTLASTCNYGIDIDNQVRDTLVCGLWDPVAIEKLLREPKLTLQTAETFLRAKEISEKQVKDIKTTSDRSMKSNFLVTDALQKQFKTLCQRCGSNHPPRKCPAFNKVCEKCQKLNHFAIMCRSKTTEAASRTDKQKDEYNLKPSHYQKNSRQVHGVQAESQQNKSYKSSPVRLGIESLMVDNDMDYIRLDTLEVGVLDNSNSNVQAIKPWYETVNVDGKPVEFKLDPGSDITTVPKTTYLTLGFPTSKLRASNLAVLPYMSSALTIVGTVQVTLSIRNRSLSTTLYVLDGDNMNHAVPLLSREACVLLGLVQRIGAVELQSGTALTKEKLFERYADIFQPSNKKLPGTYHLKLNENATPIIEPVRRVPFAIKNKMKDLLDEMVCEGNMVKVDEPTEWLLPHVSIQKGNKLKLAIDTRKINKFVCREHYRMPTFEDISMLLNGAQYFTVVDASHAFSQIKVDKETSQKLVLGTPFGRYRYLTLPYGLASSPEVFQKTMDTLFAENKNVAIYADDFVIFGQNEEEHDKAVINFLETARKNNLTLAADKIQFKCKEIKYLGRIISEKGVQADPAKILAIQHFPTPSNREELRRFLGLITFLGKYIPDLSDKTRPLRLLTSQKNEFFWSHQEESCFNTLKLIVSQAPVLRHFNPDKKCTLSVDASGYGIGAVLLQEDHPIAYASASLSPTQQRYSQIEKEALAVIVGIKKFHYYLYGTQFIVHTDHHPLLTIFKKELDSLSPRLLRLVLKSLPYTFTLVHRPGKELYVADALSRAPMKRSLIQADFLEEDSEPAQVCGLIMSDNSRKLLIDATNQDFLICKLKTFVNNGFPEHKKNLPEELRGVWPYHSELYFDKGILMRGNRIFVPKALRQLYIQQSHSTHFGINSTIRRARVCFFWPQMDTDIERYVQSCNSCQATALSKTPANFESRELPTRPWQDVATDLFEHRHRKYIIVVDYFSKFIELKTLKTTNAQKVVNALKSMFQTHGIPSCLFSDNGPPFNATTFAEFAKQYTFEHRTSSPLYPKSNGLVERAIQCIKLRAKRENTDEDLSFIVLEYNNTPRSNLPSPAKMLMGRHLHTTLPIHSDNLRPDFPTDNMQKQLREIQQQTQTKHDQQHTRREDTFTKNEPVWFQRDVRNWEQGYISGKAPQPRSYYVQTTQGNIYRRNATHICRRTLIFEPTEDVKTAEPIRNQEDNSTRRIIGTEQEDARPRRLIKPPKRLIEEI